MGKKYPVDEKITQNSRWSGNRRLISKIVDTMRLVMYFIAGTRFEKVQGEKDG